MLVLCSAFISTYREQFSNKTASISNDQELTDLTYLKKAFDTQQSNFQVKQSGKIIKILSDDVHSPKHQRFLAKLSSGQKLLIAHNVELAPRVGGLIEGAEIMFYGEYEWNNKGGVIHWTHHDPKGSHPNGWLRYKGKQYD
jgi:hypothetical protein